MDFVLPAETVAIRNMVREFALKEIEPISKKIDEEELFPADIFSKMGKLGILGITVSEEYDGGGLDYLTEGIVLEELSYRSASIGLSFGAHTNLVADNIFRNASASQKEKYLPELVSGRVMGSLCLTEPGAGSDALGGMKTIYVKEANSYLINGSKTFITNAPVAGTFLVYARNGGQYSAFILEREDGIETERKIQKMGMRGSPTGEVLFKNVKVNLDRLMGNEGDARSIIYNGLNAERAVLAFGSLGIARRALDEALNYCNQREQFGKKIGNFELIQEKLAYMFTRLEAAELLSLKAATLVSNKITDPSYAAASIMFASETATQIAKEAIQIFGGYGYTRDYPVERYLRDAILYEIGAGTTEIRKIIIAKELLKK